MAGEVDFDTGFGEGEEVGAEAGFYVGTHEFAGEVGEGAFEVGEGDVLVDVEAFDLVEVGAVGGVGGVAAVAAPGGDDADGGGVGLHIADLDGAGVATEEFAVFEVEGVLFVAGGVVGWGVERVEVVEDGFDVGAVGNGEAEGLEDGGDALGDLGDGVAGAEGVPLSGLSEVEGGGGGCGFGGGLFGLNEIGELNFEFVDGFAEEGLFGGGYLFELGHDLGEASFAGEVFDADGFDGFGGFGVLSGLQGDGFDVVEFF